MPVYNSLYTGALHDDYVTKQLLVDLIYPIGSIYISINSVSPEVLFGGTWEAIEGKFLLGADSTYSGGSTGGETSHILSVDETPAHTHTRGTMNITGTYKTGWNDSSGGGIITSSYSGALYGTRSGTAFYYSNPISSTSDAHRNLINLDASKSWTGETSSAGGGAAHNNMPPYLAVYIWKRIA